MTQYLSRERDEKNDVKVRTLQQPEYVQNSKAMSANANTRTIPKCHKQPYRHTNLYRYILLQTQVTESDKCT